MKQKKYEYQYKTRGMRVYDMKEYERFLEICRSEHTTVSRELNRFIRETVQAGTLEAGRAAR